MLKVHRLVAVAFIGPIKKSQQVNHIDGRKRNNRRENLEVTSGLKNIRHASKHGLLARGERNAKAKLTERQVRSIRKRLARGASCNSLAREFKMQPINIWRIKKRVTWKHL